MVSVSSVVASSTFTVYPGQALAPFGMGLLGPLSVTGNLTLRGNTLMDISKSGATLASDAVSATGVVDLGGTLTVKFSGSNNLAAGDQFTLFTAVPVNSSPIVPLPSPRSGLSRGHE